MIYSCYQFCSIIFLLMFVYSGPLTPSTLSSTKQWRMMYREPLIRVPYRHRDTQTNISRLLIRVTLSWLMNSLQIHRPLMKRYEVLISNVLVDFPSVGSRSATFMFVSCVLLDHYEDCTSSSAMMIKLSFVNVSS